MTRAWIIDLISSLAMGTIVGGIVVLFGGPPWAALGFGIVYYLLRPMRVQEIERDAMTKASSDLKPRRPDPTVTQ